MKPAYNVNAPKRPVNLSLNEDLVAQARQVTGNLSAEVEHLLADFVQQQQQAEATRREEYRRLCEDLNQFHRNHVHPADEFAPDWVR
ncbi:MAG: type II toxin-antitoxin system CcdA family antitoxin [Thermomonas sp.]|uniref:type II toxin-antitoxin system CcdA family antitoxin n=1 Tax=Thermomonas sp. TaxID=1971895 RepID=UPI0039E59698